MADHGYDVADPRDVEPVFGDLAEFDRLVADAVVVPVGEAADIDLVEDRGTPPGSGRGTAFLQGPAAHLRVVGGGEVPHRFCMLCAAISR
jgi:alpha-glucosidase